jgi:osmotically-inducible protein OsmY
MKTDAQIQQDVIAQIKWNPLLDASEIGVYVKNGIVTLSGRVDTFLKKMEAEKVVKKVSGVKAIAEDIMVGISPIFQRTDEEIAQAVLNALQWHSSVPDDKIQVKVEHGVVSMEGEVDWDFQRVSAREAVVNLASVRNVINNITLKQRVAPGDLKHKIIAAFYRSATIDASKVHVDVIGSKAVLTGQVRSFIEKEDAENAVLQAPGVIAVENKLKIEIEPEYV